VAAALPPPALFESDARYAAITATMRDVLGSTMTI
jgi:hypothetical protein